MASVTNHSRYLASHLDPARAGQSYAVMPKRGLGASGLLCGAIGLGTAALASGKVPDDEALYAIGQALDMQANVIDLAPTYGQGRALGLVGQAMKQRRQQAVLSLKAGYFNDGHSDFSPAGLRQSLEQSLKALGTGYADVLLLHNPLAADLVKPEAWAELAKLKQAGKIKAFGASLTTPDELKMALDKTPAQVLQFPFNVFAQDNAVVFDAALAKGVGLMANRPLDSGWLAGTYSPLSLFLDSRSRWSGADKQRRTELQEAFEQASTRSGVTAAQAALSFVLSFPQLSCAIPGASAWQQVVGNVDAAHTPLEPAIIAKLKELWDKKIKTSPLPL